MTKVQRLEELKKRMQEDKTLPLRDQATQLVFGEGNPDAEIYCLGEAPGFHEDKSGRPFVGLAGKLLTASLEEIGLKREDVYISNIVRFRPPENRDPLPEEISAFEPYINEEIEIIHPKIILTLGRFSMNKFLPDVKISQVHGQPRLINWNGMDLIIMPMYHPAAALRAGAMMKLFKEDFAKIPELLKKIEKTEESKNPVKKAEQLDLL